MSLATVKALVSYLARTRRPLPRAARILTRLSKNLHCVMAFALQRHMSWVTRAVDHGRPTLGDTPCQSCRNLVKLRSSISQVNIHFEFLRPSPISVVSQQQS